MIAWDLVGETYDYGDDASFVLRHHHRVQMGESIDTAVLPGS